MSVAKVYYNGKCVMAVDMEYVKEDSMYEYLNEIFGMFQDRAYKEFDVENKYESEARKVWKGNEDLYELKIQVEQQIEQEILADSFEKCFERVERLFCIMKEKLNADKFEVFSKLQNEEVRCFNELEQNFYAGEGCFDYVWIEWNGRKKYMF